MGEERASLTALLAKHGVKMRVSAPPTGAHLYIGYQSFITHSPVRGSGEPGVAGRGVACFFIFLLLYLPVIILERKLNAAVSCVVTGTSLPPQPSIRLWTALMSSPAYVHYVFTHVL